MKIHSLLAAFAAATLFSVPAFAQGVVISDGSVLAANDATDDFGGDMNVQVLVDEVCRIGSRDVDFGNIGALETTDVTVAVDVNALCPDSTTYTIELDYGINGTGAAGSELRRVAGGDGSGDFIDYVIHQPDAAGMASTTTPLWGTGAGAGYDAIGTGIKQTFKATAVLNLSTGGGTGTSYTPGLYTDIVVLTLTYN